MKQNKTEKKVITGSGANELLNKPFTRLEQQTDSKYYNIILKALVLDAIKSQSILVRNIPFRRVQTLF